YQQANASKRRTYVFSQPLCNGHDGGSLVRNYSRLMKTTAIALTIGAYAVPSAMAQNQPQAEQTEQNVQANSRATLLDLITISATMGWQAVIDALSATSVVDSDQ